MSNGNSFILDRLNAAVSKIASFKSITGPPRRLTVRDALEELRDEVTARNITSPSSDFDSVARSLARLGSGRRVAGAVGARELDGIEKYENGDPGWIKCLLEYVSSGLVDFPVAPPGAAIYPLQGDGAIKIALAGDWGTNNGPSQAIAGHIWEEKPDYTIHLGDVYYAGDPQDEVANLMTLWPSGRSGTFALNSNHEMYCGGRGYFQVIRNPKFGNQGFSYFALNNKDWLIVGLDTAYWAHEQSFLYQDGYISYGASTPKGTAQIDWLHSLLNNREHENKRLMILTHHDGFDVDVGTAEKKDLFDVMRGLIGNERDCVWYWGHVHAGIAYKPIKVADTIFLRARCVGHGGVPYPPFGALATYGRGEYLIDWAEQQRAATGDPRRALNGYVILTLNGRQITEEFYDENAQRRWTATS